MVDSAEEAVDAAQAIGYPVALKATGLPRLAKTEAGGVSLDLHGDEETRKAYQRMCEHLGDAMDPALVQAMAEPGIECLVGLHRHPVLGDVMTLGPGGRPRSGWSRWRCGSCRSPTPTPAGWSNRRVSPRSSTKRTEGTHRVLEDLLLRLGAIADAIPEIAQVRLNPVLVGPSGAAVTDARIRLEPWRPDPRPEVRRL